VYGYDGVHSHLWSGSIDRNFQQMRRTSPHPWRFAGGAYNPRPVHGFGYGTYYTYPNYGNYWYGGYSFGYAPGFYAGYVPSVYSYYGSWYPPYLPVERVYIIERERVIDRSQEGSSAPEQRSEGSGSQDRGSATTDGEYYLAPAPRPESGATAASESLEDTAAAIRSAWLNGDAERLQARISKKGKVRIYLSGKYKYSVDAADFGQMSRDAMERIETIGFTLDRVQKRGNDRAFVSGKHTYYNPERQKQTVHVSYGLVREQGRWMIAEAGSGQEPITTHKD